MPAPPKSKLDGMQTLQHAFDDDNGRFRVDAEVTAVIGDIEVNIDQANDSIRIGDGTDLVTTTTVGPKTGLDVNVINTVDVSATDLDIRNLSSATDSVASVQSGTWNVTNISGTISLPTGASTSANQTTSNGYLSNLDTVVREKRTYSACIHNLTIAANATDIFTITGANGVTTRIKYIHFSGEATAVLVTELMLMRRSTANSGGTSTTLTNTKHLSSDSVASSTVRAYTANPTLGTDAGMLRCKKVQISGSNTTPAENIEWVFNDSGAKAPTLTSSSEVIALNFNTVTAAGSTFCICIEWTEE